MNEKKIQSKKSEKQLLREQIRKIENRYEYKIAELSMIREIGTVIMHVRNFKIACQLILDVIINSTVAQNCSIMLLDQDRDQLFLVSATDPDGKCYLLEASEVFSKRNLLYSFKLGEGIAGQAIVKRQPILIQDIEESSIFALQVGKRVSIGSLLSIPLIVEEVPIGVLNLSHANTHIFEADDVNLFNIIADFIAISIHSALNYERLGYSEEKYRVLAENSNDGIAIIQDDVHIYANPKYQEIIGYPFEDLNKMPLEALLDISDAQTNVEDFRSRLKGRAVNKPFEVLFRSSEEKRIDAEIHYASITYDDKPALMITLRDMTEQKKVQQQLKHAQKIEAIGAIAGGVAHDLNNILSGLVSYPDLILIDLPEGSHLRRPILTMQKSGEKAAAIVQDLLTLARRGVIVKKVVDLNNIVSEYLMSPEYQRLRDFHPSFTLHINLAKDLFHIIGSPVHLSKTIMNLVSNAAEAMKQGGEIHISTGNQYVDKPIGTYDTVEEGEYVTLSVSDSGIGISPEDMKNIFVPFYTKKVMGRSGTGLGMSVVWGTVKDHKGYIDVQSTMGKGTTFTLYFPVTRGEILSDKSLLPIEGYIGKGESILVVDDIEEQRELASKMLNKLCYSVSTVASGEEAIDYMKDNSADLLILDMIMEPGMDGLETYRKILERNPKQKAIIVSGYSETKRIKEAQRLGAGRYIKKPYTLEKIGIALRNELS